MTVDPHFPALHRVHPTGWINDPNGIVCVDGRWHVYFQYNPYSARHERIHWGHMSSADLAHWQVEPLGPVPRDGEADQGGCWSGIGLLDERHAPGGTPTLVYSGVDGQINDFSRVMVARTDRALQEITEPGHVVADVPEIDGLIGVRDPFVFEFDGRRWGIQGAGVRQGDQVVPQILLYSCDDLEQWDYVGPLLTGADPVAAEHAAAELWECPQLVKVGEQWVLMLSLWFRPEVVDRSTVQVNYLLGDLVPDEHGRPHFRPTGGGRVDEGPDFYAPQAVADPTDDRVLLWGWSWEGLDRTQEQTDAQGWAGCLTFPRVLSMTEGAMVAAFAPELTALRGARLGIDQGVNASSCIEVSAPLRAEIAFDGPVAVDLVGEEGTVQELLSHNGGAGTVMIDGGIIELLPVAGSGRTLRFYPSHSDVIRTRGAVTEGWRLAAADPS